MPNERKRNPVVRNYADGVFGDPIQVSGRVTVYALLDPADRSVRYVGSTTKDVRDRLTAHHGACGWQLYLWLKALDRSGKCPDIGILQEISSDETVSDEINRYLLEERWINHFRSLGCDLLNGKEAMPRRGYARKWFRDEIEEVAREIGIEPFTAADFTLTKGRRGGPDRCALVDLHPEVSAIPLNSEVWVRRKGGFAAGRVTRREGRTISFRWGRGVLTCDVSDVCKVTT